ncbi:hypothetical protein BS47DRAFT_1374397 [Hydnum rufescens UP504]|uniref:CxC2-like cysteine cluster KDZ transposase-associated domain-containing protein n=1 Tax=Hydnum rufescens UP504 TaxID=1448309 RepID=A0A9P6AFR5_9AGAM|nr:hypothetical protein BS47DRAFT_1374397 [Hydnum rufescens UP504]
MLWNDGRGDSLAIMGCPGCQEPGSSGIYRCEECFGGELYCQGCCVKQHLKLPLHRIKKWEGSFFICTSLRALGLRLQLGHMGTMCPSPRAGPSSFVVIHVNGLHYVNIQLCSCPLAPHPRQQLMRHQWFPATVHQPQTCATFQVLRHFHLLSFQSKISTIHFYNALERETENAGLEAPPARYQAFLRMVCEYRHLKMLKRGGQGHDIPGIDATKTGELAVLCPACPHPSIPSNDCSTQPYEIPILLTLAIDANFRLKNRFIGRSDHSLGSGWAYFISTCSGLAALDHANTKSSKGLRITGVVASTCAQHGFLLPQGLGDLQKGEHYCNVDYVVFLSLQSFSALNFIIFSYDIACQWFKKLWVRHTTLPEHLQLDHTSKRTRFVIPKFHMRAHNQHANWAIMNAAANSTKEMSEGSCHDTLDDLWGDWNY